ncbi:MAG: hypothetical protein IKI54_00655 [Lachnospiraceae bacterium]|nr:hypothetical protein [Lachnospiraceae bacterium]
MRRKQKETEENTEAVRAELVPEDGNVQKTDTLQQTAAEKKTAAEEETNAAGKALKKAAGFGAAGLAALSLFLGSVFGAPAEILKNADNAPEKNAVIVEVQPDAEDVDEETDDDEDEKKKTLKDMFRAFIQRLPLGVRVFVILPLWIIGYAVIALLTALFEPVIAPVLGIVLKWLLLAGLFLLSLFLIKKAIAPDTPLKEIFSRRNLLGAGIAAAVLGTADGFLKEYVAHYEIWRNVACCAAGAVLLSVFTVRQLTKKKAKQAG